MQTKRWRTHCEHLYVNWACFSFTLFTCTEQLPNKHQPLWILGLWKATKSCLAVNKPNFFSRFKYYKMALTRWWFDFFWKKISLFLFPLSLLPLCCLWVSPLCSRLKYLSNYLMDYYELYRHAQSPEDCPSSATVRLSFVVLVKYLTTFPTASDVFSVWCPWANTSVIYTVRFEQW